MMTEKQNRDESGDESAAPLPSRLDKHGTRKKQKKHEDDTETNEENRATLKKDYQKSPMIARVLLSLFLVLVIVVLWMALFS
ncbi:hypothetical protein HUG15_10725 [Salicibibacter cibarius]|uniref:Transmembrane protein n=1 Tax=Salicibibacter cibarius TaxID=2743000 RepID=A0A7T6Z3A1_9BACI|nr:hypothetical protein [Salicibibacter cibarius]QQK75983.1 hypothetical protein HUG15_10725 [Salicibibacter cibarius]